DRDWTDTLFSLRVQGVRLDFEAGQFGRIAVDVAGSRIARAYSFVNPPQDPVLEFYMVAVPQGPLSPRLRELKRGDTLYVAPKPAGFLVPSVVPDGDTLWLISTGTGLAPFLSILRTEATWRRFDHVVVVHAVRYGRELQYGDVIRATAAREVTIVSREPHAGSLSGRIPAALRDGRLEAAAGLPIGSKSHVMLCGNPKMLRDAPAALSGRGLRKNPRTAGGHMRVKSFW